MSYNAGSSALIVANSVQLRERLQTLLKTISRIGTVFQVHDAPWALKRIAECHPALVLLDYKLANNDIQSVVRQIKIESPQTRCVILIDDIRQQWLAKIADVDGVLLTGFSAGEFLTTIEKIFSPLDNQAGNSRAINMTCAYEREVS